MTDIRTLLAADGLSDQVEEAIESAYWEFKSRMDPTQDKYISSDERYAFKMAMRAAFYRLRGPAPTRRRENDHIDDEGRP